jgi:hypothetical protein
MAQKVIYYHVYIISKRVILIAIISFTHKLNSKLNTDFLMVLKTNRVKKPVQFLVILSFILYSYS